LAGAWYHRLAAALGTALGRNLLVPGPVLVEADRLLRSRIDGGVARALLSALARGELTPGS